MIYPCSTSTAQQTGVSASPMILAKMVIRWFMQVSSSGKEQMGWMNASKAKKSHSRHIFYKASQIWLSSHGLWQCTCQYGALLPFPGAEYRSWPNVLCVLSEVKQSWGSSDTDDLRKQNSHFYLAIGNSTWPCRKSFTVIWGAAILTPKGAVGSAVISLSATLGPFLQFSSI